MSSTSRLHHPLLWSSSTKFLSLSSLSLNPPSFFPNHHLIYIKPLKFHSKSFPSFLSFASKKSINFKDDDFASSADLQFESPLKIVEYPDPRLRAKNKRINVFDDNLKNLVAEMFDVMYKTDGIGLSAPQVGVNVQLMVFNPVGERGEGEEIVLINPRVTKYSQRMTLFDEGCLSFPGLYADVKRPESVKIDAKDLSGSRFSVTLSGLPARVFQHEFDHLKAATVFLQVHFYGTDTLSYPLTFKGYVKGILFFERMTEEELDTIREGLKALELKYEKNTGLPSPEKAEILQSRKAAVGFGKS